MYVGKEIIAMLFSKETSFVDLKKVRKTGLDTSISSSARIDFQSSSMIKKEGSGKEEV